MAVQTNNANAQYTVPKQEPDQWSYSNPVGFCVPNSHSCESVLREIAFGLNSLRQVSTTHMQAIARVYNVAPVNGDEIQGMLQHVTAPFRTQLCPLPLAFLHYTKCMSEPVSMATRDLY